MLDGHWLECLKYTQTQSSRGNVQNVGPCSFQCQISDLRIDLSQVSNRTTCVKHTSGRVEILVDD